MSTSRDDSLGARQCPACSADSGEPGLAGPDGRCPSCGQPLVINADHNAIGIEEVDDGGAFAKKFRVGSHAERILGSAVEKQ